MHHRITLLAGCLALVGLPLSAQGVSGTWDAQMNTPGGVIDFQLVFKTSADTLTGKVVHQGGETPLKGTVKGDTVRFSYTIDYGGEPLVISMAAQVKGDSIKGSVDFNGNGQDQFWAARHKGSADAAGPGSVPVERPKAEQGVS